MLFFSKVVISSTIVVVHLGFAKASYILLGIEIEDNWDTNDAYDWDNLWDDTYLLMGYLTLAWRSSSYLAGGWPRLEWGEILYWTIVDSMFGVLVVSCRQGSITWSISSKLVLSRVWSRETISWLVSTTLVLSEIGSEGTSEESSRTCGEDWANWLGSKDTVLSKGEVSYLGLAHFLQNDPHTIIYPYSIILYLGYQTY